MANDFKLDASELIWVEGMLSIANWRSEKRSSRRRQRPNAETFRRCLGKVSGVTELVFVALALQLLDGLALTVELGLVRLNLLLLLLVGDFMPLQLVAHQSTCAET